MGNRTISVDMRAFHTVLAALRHWQATHNREFLGTYDIATDGGKVEPLSDEEIDALCEEINTT